MPNKFRSDNPGTNNSHYIGNELELFANAENWKSYWASKIRPLIKGSVLEVGAGIGSNLLLLRENQKWLALEPDAQQIKIINNNHKADKGLTVINGFIEDLDPSQTFQTIIYIDVLEHIEKDTEEVQKATDRLNQDGRLIVLSPAHNKLYSPFDKAVGHFRRYNKKMLTALTPPNTQIEQLYYLDSVGCVASYANAKLMKSSMPSKKQVLLWDRLMVPVSKRLDRLLMHKLGKTIVIVWKKD